MERLSRTQKFANLRESIANDREELTNTTELSHFKNRLGNIQDAFSNSEKPQEEAKTENVEEILDIIDDIFETKNDIKIPVKEPEVDLMDDINKVLAGINDYNERIGKTVEETPNNIQEDLIREANNKENKEVGDTTVAFMSSLINKVNEENSKEEEPVKEEPIKEEEPQEEVVEKVFDEEAPVQEEIHFDENISKEATAIDEILDKIEIERLQEELEPTKVHQEEIVKSLTEEQPVIEPLVKQGVPVDDIIEELEKDVEETQSLERSQLEAAEALAKQNQTLEEVNNIFENLREKILEEEAQSRKELEAQKEDVEVPLFDELVEETAEQEPAFKLATTNDIHSIDEDREDIELNDLFANEIEKEVADGPVDLVNTRVLNDEPDYIVPEDTKAVIDEIDQMIEDVSPKPIEDVQIVDNKPLDIFSDQKPEEDPAFGTREIKIDELKEEEKVEEVPVKETVIEEPVEEEKTEEPIIEEPVEEEKVEEPVEEVVEEETEETKEVEEAIDSFEDLLKNMDVKPIDEVGPVEEPQEEEEEDVDATANLTEDEITNFIKSTLDEVDQYNKAQGKTTVDEIPSTILNEVKGELLSEQDSEEKKAFDTTVNSEINKIMDEIASQNNEPISIPKIEETAVPDELTVSQFVDAFLSKKDEEIEEEVEEKIETPEVFNTMNESTKEQAVEIVNLAELEKTEALSKTIDFDEPDIDETIEVEEDEEEEEEYEETDVDTPNRVLNILLIILIIALICVLGFVVYEYISAGMF